MQKILAAIFVKKFAAYCYSEKDQDLSNDMWQMKIFWYNHNSGIDKLARTNLKEIVIFRTQLLGK